MRSVSSATWTRVDPVSVSCDRCFSITACFSTLMRSRSSWDPTAPVRRCCKLPKWSKRRKITNARVLGQGRNPAARAGSVGVQKAGGRLTEYAARGKPGPRKSDTCKQCGEGGQRRRLPGGDAGTRSRDGRPQRRPEKNQADACPCGSDARRSHNDEHRHPPSGCPRGPSERYMGGQGLDPSPHVGEHAERRCPEHDPALQVEPPCEPAARRRLALNSFRCRHRTHRTAEMRRHYGRRGVRGQPDFTVHHNLDRCRRVLQRAEVQGFEGLPCAAKSSGRLVVDDADDAVASPPPVRPDEEVTTDCITVLEVAPRQVAVHHGYRLSADAIARFDAAPGDDAKSPGVEGVTAHDLHRRVDLEPRQVDPPAGADTAVRPEEVDDAEPYRLSRAGEAYDAHARKR